MKTLTEKWDQIVAERETYTGPITGRNFKLQNSFTDLLNYTLDELNLTQTTFAESIGKNRVTVCNWTNGSTYPTLKTIIKIRNHIENLTSKKSPHIKKALEHITKADLINPQDGERKRFVRSEHIKHAINQLQHALKENNQ